MSLHKLDVDAILLLEKHKCALFAALLCEKVYPNYLLFSQEAKWGEPAIFLAVIKRLDELAFGTDLPNELVKEWQRTADNWFPDLDEWTEVATASYAFDAAGALSEAIEFILTNDKQHVVNCSTAALDTVDMFVQEIYNLDPNRPDLNKLIDENEYMKREIKRQQKLLGLLRQTDAITSDFVQELRTEQLKELPLIDLGMRF